MLKHIDGFDQYQGQSGQQLLSSLAAAGYTVSTGLAMADGRKTGTFALELQVAAGTAGSSWSTRTNNVKQDLHGVAANAQGRFLAVGNNGAAVGSDDSVTWFPVIIGVSANMRDVRVSGATWIAVGEGSTILRSSDGRNFSARQVPVANATLQSVETNGNGTWVAVGSLGAVGVILVSTDDGMTWGVRDPGMSNPPVNQAVAFGGNLWMIVGQGGSVLTSVNLSNDFTVRQSGVTTSISAVAYAPTGHWLFSTGTDVRRSVDGGANWALMNAAIATGIITSMAYSDGRWIAVTTTGDVRMTDNEDTWVAATLPGMTGTALYDVLALHGGQSGWITVGALNVTVSPASARTAIIYVSLAPPTKVARTYNVPGNKFTVGFAHRATARGRILSITGLVDLNWAGPLTIGSNQGTAVPARNVWYFYELVIDKAAKTISVFINDTADLVAPLPDAVSSQTSFEFVWMSENGAVTRIDDIYMVDATTPNGEKLVDRLGPISTALRMPTSDQGTNTWQTAAGNTHWTQVGLLPPSTESYIRSAVSGAEDLFLSNTALPAGAGSVDAPILAVGLMALAMKGDIDNRQLGLVVGAPGATQKEVVDTTLSVVPEYSLAVFEKAPGDVAWTADNVTSTPFGVVVRP